MRRCDFLKVCSESYEAFKTKNLLLLDVSLNKIEFENISFAYTN